nr:MAG TPA: hypothetical protein [Bacteriophage sp.]DAF14519.1 MAG TPA: hypothetical protein [Crassvirales sp.]
MEYKVKYIRKLSIIIYSFSFFNKFLFTKCFIYFTITYFNFITLLIYSSTI